MPSSRSSDWCGRLEDRFKHLDDVGHRTSIAAVGHRQRCPAPARLALLGHRHPAVAGPGKSIRVIAPGRLGGGRTAIGNDDAHAVRPGACAQPGTWPPVLVSVVLIMTPRGDKRRGSIGLFGRRWDDLRGSRAPPDRGCRAVGEDHAICTTPPRRRKRRYVRSPRGLDAPLHARASAAPVGCVVLRGCAIPGGLVITHVTGAGSRGALLADGRSGDEVDLLVRHVELHDRDGQTSHLGEGLEGHEMATMGPIEQALQVLLRGD